MCNRWTLGVQSSPRFFQESPGWPPGWRRAGSEPDFSSPFKTNGCAFTANRVSALWSFVRHQPSSSTNMCNHSESVDPMSQGVVVLTGIMPEGLLGLHTALCCTYDIHKHLKQKQGNTTPNDSRSRGCGTYVIVNQFMVILSVF